MSTNALVTLLLISVRKAARSAPVTCLPSGMFRPGIGGIPAALAVIAFGLLAVGVTFVVVGTIFTVPDGLTSPGDSHRPPLPRSSDFQASPHASSIAVASLTTVVASV